MSWDSWEAAADKGPEALAWKLGKWIILFAVIFTVIGVVAYPFVQGARIVEKTLDADNVIYNYEWFKTRNQDIVSLNSKIRSADAMVTGFVEMVGPRKDWVREDRIEHSRLMTIAVGLKHQRADLAAEYNAKSQMANRKIFKTGELPERIPID